MVDGLEGDPNDTKSVREGRCRKNSTRWDLGVWKTIQVEI